MNIPDSVTHLTFGYDFNIELKEFVIPDLVTHLTFRDGFNQKLKEGLIRCSGPCGQFVPPHVMSATCRYCMQHILCILTHEKKTFVRNLGRINPHKVIQVRLKKTSRQHQHSWCRLPTRRISFSCTTGNY